MGLSFFRSGVESADAQILLRELNEVLIGLLGHDGTAHVCLDDFNQDGAFFLVGYDNGVPVCCAGVRRMDMKTGEVKRLYARPNRNGYGATLMKQVEVQARVEGYERLVLECREGNAHAIGFYKRQGYTICAKYPPYEDETDAVCMRKMLLNC